MQKMKGALAERERRDTDSRVKKYVKKYLPKN